MSWLAYKMIDFDPPSELTISSVLKSMKYFEKYYNVTHSLHMHPTMIVWDLELAEKSLRRMSTRSTDREKPEVQPVRKYMLALCTKTEILFSNKRIITKVLNVLAKALECGSFEILKMDAGTPSNLAMLFSQSAKEDPNGLEFQYHSRGLKSLENLKNGLPLSEDVLEPSDPCRDVHLALGTDHSLIPKVSKLSVSLSNVPVATDIPELKGFRFREIDARVGAQSVFHLYVDLAEQGVIEKIPPWVLKLRKKGTTSVTAHYE